MPHDEARRLAALRALGVLDTEPEPRYERLVEMVRALVGVPIALLSLVDEDRQWFKAKVGIEQHETRREVSFCSHAIEANDLLVVTDARLDPRFRDNPLVTGPPHIRFYAGAVLRAPAGEPIGAVCAIDFRPRRLEPAGEMCLLEVARFAETALHRSV